MEDKIIKISKNPEARKKYGTNKSEVLPKTELKAARKYMHSFLKKHIISKEYLQDTLGMSESTVSKRITGQTFSIKEMVAIANSIDMEFVYDFIPKDSENDKLEYSEIAIFNETRIKSMAKTIVKLASRIAELENGTRPR